MSDKREKQLKKLKIFGDLFGTPSTLMDLVDAGKPQRRQRPSGMSARSMLREFKTREPSKSDEFSIIDRQVPDIGRQARSATLEEIGKIGALDVDPDMVQPVIRRLPARIQDLRKTLVPAKKGTFVTVKTKLGRTKKTRIT